MMRRCPADRAPVLVPNDRPFDGKNNGLPLDRYNMAGGGALDALPTGLAGAQLPPAYDQAQFTSNDAFGAFSQTWMR